MSLLLVFAMVLSFTATAYAEPKSGGKTGVTFEKVDNSAVADAFQRAVAGTVEENPEYADGDVVRVSIVLNDVSTLEKGYSTQGIANNTSAMRYRDGLRAKQDTLAKKISKEVLGGAKLDVVWNLTLAANIISANVEFGKIDAIKNLAGVKDVVLETRYEPAAGTETAEPNMSTASMMVGGNLAWAAGYTGAGSKVAIVDTGLDTDHELFQADAFQKAIDEVNTKRETPVTLLTAADVAAVWDELNIAGRLSGADGVYRDAKVPFGANYVDSDLDITHDNDTQGEHGSHVAGIAAANRYVTDDNGGFVPSLEKVLTQGEAPDAQLVVMKVFGKGGGAYDSDYMVAIEDALILGCDSVNLSLGSSSAGLTYNDTYADILAELAESDTVVTISAGNNYDWTEHSTGSNYLYEDDVNYATGGSPGSYPNAFTVASINNAGMTGSPVYFNGSNAAVFYTETSGYGNAPMTDVAGEYDFIFVDGPGVDDNDYSNNAFETLGEDLVKGKVAMCFRGSSSFFAKANAAAEQGAAAVIVVNNQGGTIAMNLTGYNYKVPVVSITLADGQAVMASSTENTKDGVTYYTGKVKVTNEIASTITTDTPAMSDFSSWGVPSSLTLKPEITAPGGSIYSVNGAVAGGKGYEIMSGTSMAAPQMAGLSAVMGQYVRDNDLETKTGLTARQLIQSLLMSTAEPVVDSSATGYYYSILKQGAGLANVNNALNARSYLMVTDLPDSAPLPAADSIADGKVKIEVGEVKDDSFTAAFTINNFSEKEINFNLSADFFSQLIMQGWRTNYAWPTYDVSVAWTVDGEPFVPADAAIFDFNGDGIANSNDAQHLLNYCADNTVELFCEEYADLDEDGDIDTYDAYLAFQGLNSAEASVAAGESATIGITVSGLKDAFGEDPNGNYIEGFLFVTESDTEDGAIGVTHSIPVFGYYGSWTDASMFDRGSFLEYNYGFGDGDEENPVYPYMCYALDSDDPMNTEAFLVQYAGDSDLYYFGGNPMVGNEDVDENGELAGYMPERNAINGSDLLAAAQYTQIRNAGAARILVTNQYGREVFSQESVGGMYGAYYYRNGDQWYNTSSKTNLGLKLDGIKEGTKLEVSFQLAPEYYVNEDGSVRWDDLGEGAKMSIPVVIDNTAPDIVDVSRETTDDADVMTVMAHDNQYIAAVALLTEEGELVHYYPGLSFLKRGQQYDYDFDLTALFTDEETGEVSVPDHLLVSVYDYASNQSTYKVNFNTEELEDPDVQVTLNTNEAVIVNKGSIKLVATVTPWGFEDESVTWTSSDESVVVVDENGLVTSVATEESSAVITATSNYDPTKSDSCEVSVVFIEKELNGIVWDENGEVWFSGFNTKTLPAYEKLNESSLRKELTSAAYDEDGTLYVSSFDTEEWVSTLYTADTDTWEVTSVGDSQLGYMDICQAPSLDEDHLLAVYGTYVLIVNKTTGDYEGAFNLSSFTGGNYLVGIAYEEQYEHPSYGNTDWVFLVDEAGNLYSTGFLPYNGSYSRFGVSAMGSLGYTVDTPYFQSLYYDGESLFWSRYNAADNIVNIVMVNQLYSDGSIYNLGAFADSVWPVGGLFELGTNPYFGKLAAADHSDAVVDVEAVMETEVAPISFKSAPSKAGGSLNVFKGADKPQAEGEDVVINIVAEEDLVTNGLITVTYPETATLVKAVAMSQYEAKVEEPGKIVLAHVTMDGIAKGETILELTFAAESTGTVTITTSEVNDNDAYGRVKTVELGNAAVGHDEHTWEAPVWTWDGDDVNGYTAATAKFVCTGCGEADTVAAVITVETEEPVGTTAGKAVYTATATFEGETYTDTREVFLPPERLAGTSRTATAAAISQGTFPNGAENVILASGDNYPDALAGGPLAYTLNAPILLVCGSNPDEATLNEIERLEAKNVYILGGKGAISDDVVAQLEAKGLTVTRIAGTSRFATAVEVAKELDELRGTTPTEAFFVYAMNYPDALAVGSVAAIKDAPILYIGATGVLDDDTKAYLDSCKDTLEKIYIIGGPGVISEDAETNLGAYGEVKRVYGTSRFDTCIEVNREFADVLDGNALCLAYAMNYPDALAGSVFAAKYHAPLLLVGKEDLLDSQVAYVKEKAPQRVYVFGGTGVVPDSVLEQVKAAAK